MAVPVEQLLPIGSVVMLAQTQKPLMIFGVYQRGEADPSKIFDYAAVLYPEGNLRKDVQYLFSQEDIERVLFRGYEDERRGIYLEALRGCDLG